MDIPFGDARRTQPDPSPSTAAEWDNGADPIRLLDRSGRTALDIASRLAEGRATEAERTSAELSLFNAGQYALDLDVRYGELAPDRQPGPDWHATEAAVGIVASDPWAAAKSAASSVLQAGPETRRPTVSGELCRTIRHLTDSMP